MSNIRLLILSVAILSVALYSDAGAQSASDPHAVDLTNSLIAIDSVQQNQVLAPIDLGDVNGDGTDDLMLGRVRTNTDSQWNTFEVGLLNGAAITSRFPFNNGAYGLSGAVDLNGDGRKDLISYRRNSPSDAFETFINWGVLSVPFIGEAQTRLIGNPQLGHNQLAAAADLNGDGLPEIVTQAGGVRALFYKGFRNGPAIGSLLPYDSLELRDDVYHYFTGLATGKMQSARDLPAILVAASGSSKKDQSSAVFKITYYPNPPANGLFQSIAGIQIFSDTIQNSDLFIYSTPFAVGDITGDGVDDLIVADSSSIYIFKGGVLFGTKLLTKSDADFIIKSPALLDPTSFGTLAPEATMLSCISDLNGSHVPYLVVTYSERGSSPSEHSFFYAGGAALDTYYDALLSAHSSSVPAFLSISLPNSQKGLVYTEGNSSSLVQDLASVPHKAVSSVSSGRTEHSTLFSAQYVSNHLELSCSNATPGRYSVTVCDVLGRPIIASEDLAIMTDGIYMIPAPAVASGIYLLRITGKDTDTVIRLLR